MPTNIQAYTREKREYQTEFPHREMQKQTATIIPKQTATNKIINAVHFHSLTRKTKLEQ